MTIFVSTAYLDEAERASRVGLMHRGKLLAVGTPQEVKKLMRGAILEIRSADPRKAAAVLRAHFPDASVGLFGDRVHVVAKDLRAAEAGAVETLRAAGVELTSARPVEPTLEDVFVSVLGEAK